MKRLIALLMLVTMLILGHGRAQNPSFKSFDPSQFSTNNFTIRILAEAFGGTNFLGTVYITNLYVTNLFSQFFYTSNEFVTNLYVTNLYAITSITTNLTVQNLISQFFVSSNVVAGNIQGTTNTLAMFGPDNFSLENSIVTQPDTNTITFNAGSTNVGVLIFGPYTNQLSTDGINPTWNGVPIGGGGGTSPWTNDTGIVQMSDGQTATNVLLFVSGMANNSTNIAARIDTANAWGSGKLMSWGNAGVEMAYLDNRGGILVSPNTALVIADTSSSQTFLSGHVNSLGDANQNIFQWGSFSDLNFTNYAQFTLTTDSSAGLSDTDLLLEAYTLADSVTYEMSLVPSDPFIKLVRNSAPKFWLNKDGQLALASALFFGNNFGGNFITFGAGNPNGSVNAPKGSLYLNTSGGAGTTLYVNEAGGTTWVGK